MVTALLLAVSYTGRASQKKKKEKKHLAPPLSSAEFQVSTVNDQYNAYRNTLEQLFLLFSVI